MYVCTAKTSSVPLVLYSGLADGIPRVLAVHARRMKDVKRRSDSLGQEVIIREVALYQRNQTLQRMMSAYREAC